MLFTPAAHEALVDEPWDAEAIRIAIAAVVADAESAFEDGWPAHPRDLLPHEDPATRFRNLYEGGAGVVEALHRLARRGFVELRRDYVPSLEDSVEAPSASPTTTSSAAFWRARRESGSCSSGRRLRRRISTGCPS